MRNILNEVLFLFNGTVIEKTIQYKTFDLTLSFADIHTNYFNFILPKVAFSDFDWNQANQIREEYKEKGTPIHFYLSQNNQSEYKDFFVNEGKNPEIESLVYVENAIVSIDTTLGITIEDMTEETIRDAGDIANVCFGTYENNYDYVAGVFRRVGLVDKQLSNTFLILEGKRIGIGQVIYSIKRNIAYFHNFAILPEYRRKGYFSQYKNMLTQQLLTKGITTFCSINALDAGSYAANKKMGWHEYDRLCFVE